MNQQIKEQYDSLYANMEIVFGYGESFNYIPVFNQLVLNGKVLDVGGGDGQNALRLAEQGCRVTVFDLSEVGLKKAKFTASKKGLDLETIFGDITKKTLAGSYDGVIMAFVLHHINEGEAVEVIKKLQNQTNVGGVHFIATFGDKGGLYERAKGKGRFYPDIKKLEILYEGWNTVVAETKEVASLAKDKQGNPLVNEAVFYLAQKPN